MKRPSFSNGFLKNYFLKKKQQGSMLLMTMIILVMFVFSGLFIMETAMLQELTVSNEQRSLQVQKVAFGELVAQMGALESTPDVLNNARTSDQNLTIISTPAGCTTPGQVCQTATLSFVGQSPPPAGYSVGDYIGLAFEINSVATLNETSARSDQTVGFTYVVRAPGR